MTLIKDIKRDANYKSFRRILEAAQQKLDVEAALEEAKVLHAARISRALTGNDRYRPKRLIDAAAIDLSTRARLVELRVVNDRKLSHLRKATDALKSYVATEYAEDINEDFRSADQRKAFIDRVVKPALTLLNDGESLLSSLDFLIKDLDQASHSLRHIVDALKLMENKHGSKAI